MKLVKVHRYRCVFEFQSLMEKVKADMEWCLAKCHHNDQSLNFGKCLLHITDMACTDQGGVRVSVSHLCMKYFCLKSAC